MQIETPTMLLFWQADSVFSNWYRPAPFRFDGHAFENSEAGMMYQKARLFGDREAMAAILRDQDPRTVKRVGRTIRGFDETIWTARREELVYEVCFAKFVANPELRAALLATGDRLIVEASPVDPIWGIGLAPDDPLAQDPERWRGLNLLGRVLMRVREALRGPAAA